MRDRGTASKHLLALPNPRLPTNFGVLIPFFYPYLDQGLFLHGGPFLKLGRTFGILCNDTSNSGISSSHSLCTP